MNKSTKLKLLGKKIERFEELQKLSRPNSKLESENIFMDFAELGRDSERIIQDVAGAGAVKDFTEACFASMADVDESDGAAMWRAFRRSLYAAHDWLTLFLSEHSSAEIPAEKSLTTDVPASGKRGRVFIGHGGSPLWRELKDFLEGTLKLGWEEFNRDVIAGISTTERISQMLDSASFAFIVMTAEDKHADGTQHARENVVHEAGLFQGKLGFRKAIILIEDGCEEFSNIRGLTQIRFPKGDILARSEEIRGVLKREGILE